MEQEYKRAIEILMETVKNTINNTWTENKYTSLELTMVGEAFKNR